MAYLDREYLSLKQEIDKAIETTINSTQFIGGPEVEKFEGNLSGFLKVNSVISCANGTDALLAAFLALELKEGDEVIMPSFGYISAYEVCRLLRLRPILVDVELNSFNIDSTQIQSAVTNRTKVILVQHLFGLPCDMDEISAIASKYNLFVIEDTAQAIGSMLYRENKYKYAGTIGHIGTFSFFPTKNLGCYGDGGALCTNDDNLALRIRQIVTHGQNGKYNHERLGINSRLDALQAGILSVKISQLSYLNQKRKNIAIRYQEALSAVACISLPTTHERKEHVYHQFTIRCLHNTRDSLKNHLSKNDVASTVYYQKAIHQQKVYQEIKGPPKINSEKLVNEVLSIPIHPFMIDEEVEQVIEQIKNWENGR